MEALILMVVALGALAAFGAGVVLLILYFRAGRGDDYDSDPVMYGDLVQCPRCGYMNPPDTGACLNCRLPFNHAPAGYLAPPQPQQPSYPPPPVPAQRYTAPSAVPQQTVPAQATAQPAQGMPRAWLEGVGGVMLGQVAPLVKADTLVGRSTSCDVQVFDPKVSRHHFLIRYGKGSFFLQDQQSSRGTLINGQRVMAQRLQSGDRIDVGDSSLIFRIG